jgi:hypothetical protein
VDGMFDLVLGQVEGQIFGLGLGSRFRVKVYV